MRSSEYEWEKGVEILFVVGTFTCAPLSPFLGWCMIPHRNISARQPVYCLESGEWDGIPHAASTMFGFVSAGVQQGFARWHTAFTYIRLSMGSLLNPLEWWACTSSETPFTSCLRPDVARHCAHVTCSKSCPFPSFRSRYRWVWSILRARHPD